MDRLARRLTLQTPYVISSTMTVLLFVSVWLFGLNWFSIPSLGSQGACPGYIAEVVGPNTEADMRQGINSAVEQAHIIGPGNGLLTVSGDVGRALIRRTGIVELWDVKNRKLLQSLSNHPEVFKTDQAHSVVLSPSGKLLAMGYDYDNRIALFRWDSQNERLELCSETSWESKFERKHVRHLTFSADESRLAALSYAGDARVFSLESDGLGAQLASFSIRATPLGFLFSPRNKLLITDRNGSASLWNGEKKSSRVIHSTQQESVGEPNHSKKLWAQFSGDGSHIIAAKADDGQHPQMTPYALRWLDAETGKSLGISNYGLPTNFVRAHPVPGTKNIVFQYGYSEESDRPLLELWEFDGRETRVLLEHESFTPVLSPMAPPALVNMGTGQPIGQLHEWLQISPDANAYLPGSGAQRNIWVVGDWKGRVRFINMANGDLLHTMSPYFFFSEEQHVVFVDVLMDGERYQLTYGDGTKETILPEHYREKVDASGLPPYRITSLHADPKGEQLLVAYADGRVVSIDVKAFRNKFKF